jgi:hypothetical protein
VVFFFFFFGGGGGGGVVIFGPLSLTRLSIYVYFSDRIVLYMFGYVSFRSFAKSIDI